MKFLIKGTFIDTPNTNKLRIRKGFLLIKDDKIVSFHKSFANSEKIKLYDYSNHLIIPGLVDLHLHAPQYNFIGTNMDLELMDWLDLHAFPEETKFSNLKYANKSHKLFVDNLIKSATTRAIIFSSIYTNATLNLMNQLEHSRICSYVGKVSMDRNSPSYYVEKNGIQETTRFLKECFKRKYQFVKPIITPRFAPSVSDSYMEKLGELAIEYNTPVQSHLSENKKEIELVKKLYPNNRAYCEAYSKHGLFSNPTKAVMAHCVHSDNFENKMLKKNGVYIAHCPTSNINLCSGACPAAYYLRNNYHIGLGSDIAGGHTLDLFEVMKIAILNSKNKYRLDNDKDKPLTLAEVLYMATIGGGSFFGKVGLFDKGYEFDALVLNDNNMPSSRKLIDSERLERFIYINKGSIKSKFIKGNKIF